MSAGGMASNVLVRSANAEIYLLAKVVQTESRDASLLAVSAEVQPIFCKDTNLIGMQRDMRKNHPTKLELLGRRGKVGPRWHGLSGLFVGLGKRTDERKLCAFAKALWGGYGKISYLCKLISFHCNK